MVLEPTKYSFVSSQIFLFLLDWLMHTDTWSVSPKKKPIRTTMQGRLDSEVTENVLNEGKQLTTRDMKLFRNYEKFCII